MILKDKGLACDRFPAALLSDRVGWGGSVEDEYAGGLPWQVQVVGNDQDIELTFAMAAFASFETLQVGGRQSLMSFVTETPNHYKWNISYNYSPIDVGKFRSSGLSAMTSFFS